MEDPIEAQPPGGDHLLVLLRAEKSGDRISLTPPDNIPLDLCRDPAIETW